MYTFLANERWPGLRDKSVEGAVLIASNCGVKQESPLRTGTLQQAPSNTFKPLLANKLPIDPDDPLVCELL
jgi:hypothetical protein